MPATQLPTGDIVRYLFSSPVVALAVVWLLWSGHYTALLVGLGLCSCVLVAAVSARMGIADGEGHPIHLLGRSVLYWPWLLWSIARANVAVARCILHPRLPISPTLVQVRAGQKSTLGRVVYANSITLTPGTVSLDVSGDLISVHALTRASAGELLSGAMDRRVSAMEGQP